MKLRNIVCTFITCVMLLSVTACTSSNNNDLSPSNDKVSGTAWISNADQSYMTFTGTDDFTWYMEKANTEDNYFKGTYEFYIGEAAMNHLTVDLEEFGVSAEEMETIFKNNEEYSIDNFVCMTVHNTSFMLDGEEQLSEPQDTNYFGFILMDCTYLDIANMGTGTYYGFEKE